MKIFTGKVKAPRKCMLYGTHGIGKSTWAAEAPGVVFLNLEDGLNNIDCSRSDHITSLEGVLEFLNWLIAAEHQFYTLAIDSMDWLESIIHAVVAEKANKAHIADIGYGAGYKQALGIWDRIMMLLEMLRAERRMGIVLLAHASVKRFESPDQDSYDRYQPALHDSASAMWQEWSDEVLFASYRVYIRKEDLGFDKERAIPVDGNERFLRTQESPAVLAKNRLHMPPEIEFSWGAYQACFPA